MFSGLKKLFGRAAGVNPDDDKPLSVTQASTDFLCHEPVFSKDNRPLGHLFQLRPPIGDETMARCEADANLLTALKASPEARRHGTAFVPISSASLTAPALEQLPGKNIVLLLQLAPDAEADIICDAITEFREREFSFGVFRQPKNPAFAKVIQKVDYAAIDVARNDPNTVRDFSAAVRAGVQANAIHLFACNIETLDEHQLCVQWHYSHCHGRFAEQSVDTPSAPAGDPHKTQLLHLLNLVQGDAENAEIAKAMKLDPVLSFRILRYLNSPALALTRRIDSLEQALIILGRQKLTRWLAVLLFSVREPQLSDWLLIENALTRGRLMEVLGEQCMAGAHHDALFLTGIFSFLDRLLRRPMADILQAMPIADEIRQALLDHDGPYAPLLAVAEAAESRDPAAIASATQIAGIDAEIINRALLTATAWACEVTEYWD